jgi:hypothetical protein
LIGVEDSFFEVRQSFVESPVHETVSVQHHAIEDQVFGLVGAIGELVNHKLAIDEGINMETLDVSRNWKV